MTCLEKWKLEHGDKVESDLHPALNEMCPSDYGYLKDSRCGDVTCKQCWEREVLEDTVEKFEPKAIPLVNSTPVSDEVMEEVVEDLKTGVPTILDSGDRTEFATGARRDMRAGKGRFDISPIEVISRMIDQDGDVILDCIADFMRSNDTRHLYDALNTFTAAFYNQMETLLLETAVHFEEGAKKYGEANYRLGIPVWCYIDSAIRHYIKWLRGDKEERHDRAFCWNLMCCIWEVDYGEKWRASQSKAN